MRRLSLTLLLLAAPVLAQEATEPPAAAPQPEAPAASPEAAPAARDSAPAQADESPAEPREEAAPPPARKRRPKPAPKPAAKVVKPAPAAPEAKAPEAKAPAPETAAPEAAPKVAEPAPAPSAEETSGSGKLSPRQRVAEEARVFFSLLLTGDVRALGFRLDFPFQLEGRRFTDNEELVSEWVKSLRQRRTDLVTLYDIEVLTPEEMERKHGAPPKRLGALDYRTPNTYVAVANLSGRAAVAVFRITQGSVKAVAYTD